MMLDNQNGEMIVQVTREQLGKLSDVQLANVIDQSAQQRIARYQTMHGLHVLLSLITAGLWIIVWALVAWSNGRERDRATRRAAQFKTELMLNTVNPDRLFKFIRTGV